MCETFRVCWGKPFCRGPVSQGLGAPLGRGAQAQIKKQTNTLHSFMNDVQPSLLVNPESLSEKRKHRMPFQQRAGWLFKTPGNVKD